MRGLIDWFRALFSTDPDKYSFIIFMTVSAILLFVVLLVTLSFAYMGLTSAQQELFVKQ